MKEAIERLEKRIRAELEKDILPFWYQKLTDMEYGGFYGYADNENRIDRHAPKGGVLNSRILWTYSVAYRLYGLEAYKNAADHAYQYLKNAIWDRNYSGLYWMVNYQGKSINARKQIYNIAFGIYGLSEYYRAVQNEVSLELAKDLFFLIEKYSFDPLYGGYIDAFTEKWEPIEDKRLSTKDLNAAKTMNTHLHILEAYTNLYRVWKDTNLRQKLHQLIQLTMDKIVHPESCHFILFFENNWNPMSEDVSYGHDIEGSWLICEAAEVLGDKELIRRVNEIALKMADAVLEEGYDQEYGGIYNEYVPGGGIDFRKDWWPQAEAIVGFFNAWQLTRNEKYLESVIKTWDFIENHMVDHQYGEWFGSVSRKGMPNKSLPKVQPWKCPYHNSRACFEFLSRLGALK